MAKQAKPNPKRATDHAGPATGADPAPPEKAVALMDDAMKAMQGHKYQRAAETFKTLIDDYPRERALLERARVFLEACLREASDAPEPQTLEERVTAATAALNEDDDAAAESLAKGVLGEKPDHDIALYLLAAVQARRGHADSALAYLRQAVEISAEAGAQARLDEDFDLLRDHDGFRELTESLAAESNEPTGPQ